MVVLGFDYEFHRGKVEEEKNRRDVEDVLGALMGQKCRVRCVLTPKGQPARAAAPAPRRATAAPAEPDGLDDPVVRAAIEDLGAQIVQRPQSTRQ